MASPLGTFADLSSYRRLVDAQKAQQAQEGGALNQLIRGFNQGAMEGNTAINIPEVLAQQNEARRNAAIRDTIATQIAQENLKRAQNPNIGLNDLIQKELAQQAVNPYSGITVAPAGLEGETIQQPAALTPEQNSFFTNPGAYGLRADSTNKGPGFFGPLKRPDGSVSTELSVGVNMNGQEVEIPSLVPTLTEQEKSFLINGGDARKNPSIIQKATEFARGRISQGLSPFAQANEQPLPKAGVAITPMQGLGQPSGFNFNPETPLAAQNLVQQRALDLAEARRKANKTEIYSLPDGTFIRAIPGQEPEGATAYVKPSAAARPVAYINPNDFNDIEMVASGQAAPEGKVPAKEFLEGQKVKQTAAPGASIDNDVESILEGRNTSFNIRQNMGRSDKSGAYMKAIRDKIQSIDPKFDYIASDAGGKSVSTPYVQRANIAINSVLPNLDRIIDLSKDVDRIGIKGIDNLIQKAGVQFGNKKISNFRQARNLLADEVGVALGAGAVSDMKLQLGFDVTDPNVPDEVFASNMGIIKDFLNARKQGLNSLRYQSSTINNPVQSPVGTPGINPNAPSPVINQVPTGMKRQRNSKTGEVRLVPIQ